MRRFLLFLLLSSLAGPLAQAADAPFGAASLRCEYRTDPLGIGVATPRLSWIVTAPAGKRGVKQSAYRLLVASSPDKLAQDQGDLWDSGEVATDQTAQITYAGAPLASRARCWWKVQLWDAQKQPSGWSAPAHWTLGLLKPDDWQAKWIGLELPTDSDNTPEMEARVLKQNWAVAPWPDDRVKPQTAYFRREITLPEGATITHAGLHLSPSHVAVATVNGEAAGEAYRWALNNEIPATKLLHGGVNVIGLTITEQDGYAPAVKGEVEIEVEGQPPLYVPIDSSWEVFHQVSDNWLNPGYKGKNPQKAEERRIIFDAATPCFHQLLPPPYLRAEFQAERPVKRATLYASALGAYEMHLNGQKVGHDLLTPGWTDYRHRVTYQTYDVTSLVQPGANVLGGLLGDGWFCVSYTGRRYHYGAYPRLKAQLEIEYADGGTKTVATDENWKATDGPWRHGDIWIGSEYDSTREIPGWDQPGHAPGNWRPVTTGLVRTPDADPKIVVDEAKLAVDAASSEPVRALEELPALSVTEPQSHVYVFDLGQNMAGWVRLQIAGQRGQKITVRHGEMLNPNGTIYTGNLRGACATDFYTLKGGPQTLEPFSTFHGFRYVEVLGLDEKPDDTMVTGVVVRSDIPETGQFTCSDPRVNQLFHNILWGQKANYLSIPTDCPQRDERLGWTGDTQFFMRTGVYDSDVANFFTNHLVTMCEDSQLGGGDYTFDAPTVYGGHGATGWSDAASTCVYVMYRTYGDTRVIADHWNSITRYIDWVGANTDKNTGISHVGGFGDWLNMGGGASADVIDTAYHAYLAQIMTEMAHALGKADEEQKYLALREKIAGVFAASFIQPDGKIKESSQTGFALAFTMGLVPPEMREKMAGQFVADIEGKKWHLGTGFIGTPRLLPALHEAGRDDVAYKLLLQDTYPSWLYQVKLGATTMWEHWDSWTPEKGFQGVNMNSFNHYAFGSVGEYLYRYVAGIDTDGAGYRKIVLAPQPQAGLTSASGRYDSINGPIACAWETAGEGATGDFTLTADVPPNTTATVRVPAAEGAQITEGATPADQSPGVTLLKREKDAAYYTVGSGHYVFRTK
jgi:alpha-L-rhamnosidase